MPLYSSKLVNSLAFKEYNPCYISAKADRRFHNNGTIRINLSKTNEHDLIILVEIKQARKHSPANAGPRS